MPADTADSDIAKVDVAIIGAGFAGLAAAWELRRHAGQSVGVAAFFSGDGAAGLCSGVVDQGWQLAPSQPLVHASRANLELGSQELLLLRQLGMEAAVEPMLVASSAGVLRSVVARDPALLDFAASSGNCVAIADFARPGWDAAWLARALSETPLAQRHHLSFEPRRLALADPWWLTVGDYDLARGLEQEARLAEMAGALGQAAEQARGGRHVAAWLFGPWLGVHTDVAAELAKSTQLRIGETTSLPGGVAGARFALRRDALLEQLEVAARRVEVLSLERRASDWVLQLSDDRGASSAVAARSVVLASGGIVGGGVQLRRTPRGLRLESAVRGELPMSFGGTDTEPAASAFGPELVRWGVAGLARAGVARLPQSHGGLFLAGDVMVGAEGALAAVRSGIQAGEAVFRWLGSSPA